MSWEKVALCSFQMRGKNAVEDEDDDDDEDDAFWERIGPLMFIKRRNP